MDRLTTEKGKCKKCFIYGDDLNEVTIDGACDIKCLKKFAEKLTAYENTGLEPEEIQAALPDNAKIILDSANVKEENGRLIAENEMLRNILDTEIYALRVLIDNIRDSKEFQADENKASNNAELEHVKKIVDIVKSFDELSKGASEEIKLVNISSFHDGKTVAYVTSIDAFAKLVGVELESRLAPLDYMGVTFVRAI
jgi:hypothetical protein